jgi:hypothetical protein
MSRRARRDKRSGLECVLFDCGLGSRGSVKHLRLFCYSHSKETTVTQTQILRMERNSIFTEIRCEILVDKIHIAQWSTLVKIKTSDKMQGKYYAIVHLVYCRQGRKCYSDQTGVLYQLRKYTSKVTILGVPLRLFNYLKNCATYRENVLSKKCVLSFSLQVLSGTFLGPISIQRVTLEISAEMNTGLHVKCPISLSDSNQNWNVSTNFSKIHRCQILWICVQRLSSC